MPPIASLRARPLAWSDAVTPLTLPFFDGRQRPCVLTRERTLGGSEMGRFSPLGSGHKADLRRWPPARRQRGPPHDYAPRDFFAASQLVA